MNLSNLTSRQLCEQRPYLEAVNPVLWVLLQASAYLDDSLKQELSKDKRVIACRSGCHACCLQPIPLSMPEVMGIGAFLRLPEVRFKLPAEGGSLSRCTFLNDEGRCLIYPVRPFACRRFLVFGKPCAENESPIDARPQDMHWPSEKALFNALRLTMPVYNFLGLPPPENPDQRFLLQNTYILQDFQNVWENSLDVKPAA